VFKKLVAALATVALTAGLSTVAIASASADDGEATVTYSTSVTAAKAKEEKASEEEKAKEEKASEEEKAKEEKAKEEKAAEEQAKPVLDAGTAIVLTYMTGCAPDATNTWRVRNPSSAMVFINYNNGGMHKAEPGDTFFETARNTKETMIISWGKDGSGVKPGRVVKAASGSDLPNTSPSCAIIAPSASIAVTECVYDPNGKAAFREVRITFDNRQSNVPVAFTVPWFARFDKTLEAGETFTFRAANMWPKGGGYSVVANGQTFRLPIVGCVEPTKPADVVVTSVSLPTSFDCTAGIVSFTSTTSTTSFEFNTLSVAWVEGKTVQGPPVPLSRPFTPEETAEHCATAAAESPRASSCSTTDDQSPYTRWIRLALDPSLEYSITNDQTAVKTVPTSNYVQLAVGNYTVRVAAAFGYILSQGAIERWSLAVADSGSCAPNPTPDPTPSPTPVPSAIPTTGGSSTSPQGASTGGDDILEASAVSKLPTLDLATDGAALNSAGNSAVDPAADNAVDGGLRTGNQTFVNFVYVAIGALTVLLLWALILLARRYRAAADQ